MSNQRAIIEWRDGNLPVSKQFDDPYYSLNDGLDEARHVFLHGNHLPRRFCPGFHIAELGFGTGLNMLCTWHAWNRTGQTDALNFTSFEQFPMAPDDMATALAAFPELAELAEQFLRQWATGKTSITLPGLNLTVLIGDARATLPNWPNNADAWYLDGFSPAKNPELWSPELLKDVASHTTPGGTFATYTAAGHVRRSLAAAGFCVTRVPGHGLKRHMTIGQLAPQT